jgi:peptidyl-prolyl cis-trans isomerase A (cyclophilin A)
MRCVRNGMIALMVLAGAVALGNTFQQAAEQPNTERLMNPAALTETAPDNYEARFVTSQGTIGIQVRRAWAPIGADRFYNLVKNGFYDNCRFFRVLYGFAAQFGINGDPKINTIWSLARIQDDPVKQSNRKGYVSFAKGGPNTRTTQVFISLSDDNVILDGQGFAPFGTVTRGTDVVAALYSDYGDGPPQGKGPDQMRIVTEGNAYLQKLFPKLDYIKSTTIVTKSK